VPTTLTGTPVVASSLAGSAITLQSGLFPGFFPSATAFPGRGNTLGAQAVSPSTLIGSAA